MNTKKAIDTVKLGQRFAKKLRGGDVLVLIGDLGSGKTTFVKGLAKGLGVKNNITSPTFVLFKVYKADKGKIKHLVHADCYRVPGKEFCKIGIDDYFYNQHTITVIEWGEKLPKLPRGAIKIYFQPGPKNNERVVKITK